MLFTTAKFAALAAFLPRLVSAHMELVEPKSVFRGVEGHPNDPLDPSGSNYPCYWTFNPGAEAPVWEQGSQQRIVLRGSAVHGGGSCQVSFTLDNPPTKNSVFKVVQSIEGGCPKAAAGNLVASEDPAIPFTVPADMPVGGAVVAWTWFNKIGNREMYMRCAPVKIAGKNTSGSTFNSLPEIFKANIKGIGADNCSTKEGEDLIFPSPGSNLRGKGTLGPLGTCPKIQAPAPIPSPPILIDKPAPTPTSTLTPSATPSPSKAPEQPPVEKPKTTTTTTSSARQQPTSTPTPKPDPPKGDVPNPSPPAGACVDGEIICTGPTTWSICNFGVPVPMGSTAAGMECSGGKMVLAKRNVRFSHDHMRRRHNTKF